MRRSRRERLTFKRQSPNWNAAKELMNNFVYDSNYTYTVYFVEQGKRKEESFEFHHVIVNEPIEVEGDINLDTYTFVRYKYKTTIANGLPKSELTTELSKDKVLDELIIDRIEPIENFDWTKAPKLY